MKSLTRYVAASLAVLLCPLAAHAQASDNTVKIGILNDQSGVYADFGGKWSVEAARMAVEDFGGKVLNTPIEIINADHQNKPDIASSIARQWYDTTRSTPSWS
jgi:branched-chain amino acid transport system substrate-binding protein